MYQSFESLAAALRVFVTHNPTFSYRSLESYLIDKKLVSHNECRMLFETFGAREDCFIAINKRRYKWICDREFFSNNYVLHIVEKLGFKECKYPIKRELKPVLETKQPNNDLPQPTKRQEQLLTLHEIPLDIILDEIKRRGYNLTLTK